MDYVQGLVEKRRVPMLTVVTRSDSEELPFIEEALKAISD
jgi:hypothetical protein